VAGIEEGRFTYSNLRKIIYLLISTGAAGILMVALSMLSGLPIPFLPVQLLWLNLVTNGLQDVGLAFEKGEPGLMHQPPRHPNERVFNAPMIRQTLLAAATMTCLTFGLWYHLLNNLGWPEAEARNIALLLMVMLQNFHVFNCRSETRSAFLVPLRNNYPLVFGVIALQGLHIASMHIPFMQELLHIAPVSFADWLKLLPTAGIILVVLEIYKWRQAVAAGSFRVK
jgi:magnesium-transporting ATPase (P-type)